MRLRRNSIAPIISGILVLSSVAVTALAALPPDDGVLTAPDCGGYCSGQSKSCLSPYMYCCCDISGSWKCVCRLPTECAPAYGCQHPQ